MTIAEYLDKNHADKSEEIRNAVEDAINAAQAKMMGIDKETIAKREVLLRFVLKGTGFTDEEIHSFAVGIAPVKMVTIPVDIEVPRNYRIYVRVQEDAEPEEVKQATMEYIVCNGLDDADIDVQIDDPANDTRMTMDIDWDGAMYD